MYPFTAVNELQAYADAIVKNPEWFGSLSMDDVSPEGMEYIGSIEVVD